MPASPEPSTEEVRALAFGWAFHLAVSMAEDLVLAVQASALLGSLQAVSCYNSQRGSLLDVLPILLGGVLAERDL